SRTAAARCRCTCAMRRRSSCASSATGMPTGMRTTSPMPTPRARATFPTGWRSRTGTDPSRAGSRRRSGRSSPSCASSTRRPARRAGSAPGTTARAASRARPGGADTISGPGQPQPAGPVPLSTRTPKMLDPSLLRKDLESVRARLARRGFELDATAFEALEARRKSLQTATESLQAKRNALSKTIGQLKAKGEDTSAVMAEVAGIGAELDSMAKQNEEVQEAFAQWLMTLPNLPADRVPDGRDETGNVEQRRWAPGGGTEPPTLPFAPRDHVELGAALGLDFEMGAKLSGARFSVLRGPAARLHRALAQFMLDVHTTEHGYLECYTPYIVNAESLRGTGQLPKFEQDLFAARKGGQEGGGEALYLIPTSEV